MAQDNIVHQKHTRYPFQATGILTIFAEENQTILFMCKTKYLITALAIAMTGYCRADVPPTLDLSGQWQVSLDSMETFQPIRLPGTTDIAGLGVKNTLQPELAKPQVLHLTRKHSFVGAAWYRRTFSVGKEMAGRPLTLLLERIIWQSQVWIDGVKPAQGGREPQHSPRVLHTRRTGRRRARNAHTHRQPQALRHIDGRALGMPIQTRRR